MRLLTFLFFTLAPMPALAVGNLTCLATSICGADGCAAMATPMSVAFDPLSDTPIAQLAIGPRLEALPMLAPPDGPDPEDGMVHYSSLADGAGVEMLLDYRGTQVTGTLWLHDTPGRTPLVIEATCLAPLET